MIKSFNCAQLSVALEKLKEIVKKREEKGKRTVIFCEDRLSLAAERAVCAAVDGTFLTSVFSFARFLSAECGKNERLLTSRGSAMAVRAVIEANRGSLPLLKRLPASSAAQSVYAAIALLYSSRISADDVLRAAERGGLLGSKLKDVATVYKKYEEFLVDTGKEDRNGYLAALAPVIEKSRKINGAAVVFLGFQAFTAPAAEAVAAAFLAAEETYGLFIGGSEDVYVNEASAKFLKIAKAFGGAENESIGSSLCSDADVLRRGIFNPESFHSPSTPSANVFVVEAADGQDEFEFIAARIKKCVQCEGIRYSKISVMLPDLSAGVRDLARVFSAYDIPYYADKRLSLASQPLCAFIISYLSCVLYGCRPQDVDGVVSSPLFPAEREQKDIFRNYLLRACNYRGGVKKEPSKEALEQLKFDCEAVTHCRKSFLRGLSYFSKNTVNSGIFGGLLQLFEDFGVQKRLQELGKMFEKTRPVEGQLCLRAYDEVLSVLREADSLAGGLSLSEYVKLLKSGFAAAEVALIPPKADAVFVGDLSATVNTGSDVVFAARLTSAVPGASDDTAMLTDGDIDVLESAGLSVTPKIEQVNLRRQETCALNVCAFRKSLYLSYPVRLGGEECSASEIISYASALFYYPTANGKTSATLKPITTLRIEKSQSMAQFYASEPLPALRRLQKVKGTAEGDALARVLIENGYGEQVKAVLATFEKDKISCGKKLYFGGGNLSPTTLESYFGCPYSAFITRGLRANEREEGMMRRPDSGIFIHAVLQESASAAGKIENVEAMREYAREIAEEKLKIPPFSALVDTNEGRYTAARLADDAATLACGVYEQLQNSRFKVQSTEIWCELPLFDNVKLSGKTDRVDEYDGMVRIIDYKTGGIDVSASAYYSGRKLQLPLYLSAVSNEKRAAGAYYFPAAVEFSEKKDGIYRLQGFMDCSSEIVAASDCTVASGELSKYVNAYLDGKKLDRNFTREEFENFLSYSRLVSEVGARELIDGNIAPSPAPKTCSYCKAGGCCGFTPGRDGEEREAPSVKYADITDIVKRAKGESNE